MIHDVHYEREKYDRSGKSMFNHIYEGVNTVLLIIIKGDFQFEKIENNWNLIWVKRPVFEMVHIDNFEKTEKNHHFASFVNNDSHYFSKKGYLGSKELSRCHAKFDFSQKNTLIIEETTTFYLGKALFFWRQEKELDIKLKIVLEFDGNNVILKNFEDLNANEDDFTYYERDSGDKIEKIYRKGLWKYDHCHNELIYGDSLNYSRVKIWLFD